MSAKAVRFLWTDVDGTLTRGTVFMGEKGEFVEFNVQDGAGHRLAELGGLTVGWLSGRNSKAVARRAGGLGVSFLYQGVADKLAAARRASQERKIPLAQTAFMGDDLMDIPLLKAVGFSAAPANARAEVKRSCRYVTKAKGGEGAFREVVEKILRAQGRWEEVVRRFQQGKAAPRNY